MTPHGVATPTKVESTVVHYITNEINLCFRENWSKKIKKEPSLYSKLIKFKKLFLLTFQSHHPGWKYTSTRATPKKWIEKSMVDFSCIYLWLCCNVLYNVSFSFLGPAQIMATPTVPIKKIKWKPLGDRDSAAAIYLKNFESRALRGNKGGFCCPTQIWFFT